MKSKEHKQVEQKVPFSGIFVQGADARTLQKILPVKVNTTLGIYTRLTEKRTKRSHSICGIPLTVKVNATGNIDGDNGVFVSVLSRNEYIRELLADDPEPFLVMELGASAPQPYKKLDEIVEVTGYFGLFTGSKIMTTLP